MAYHKYTIHRNYLKEFMNQNSITVKALSDASQISVAAIFQVRQHRQEPMEVTKELICKALKADKSVIFPVKEVVGPSKSRCGRKYIAKGVRLCHI